MSLLDEATTKGMGPRTARANCCKPGVESSAKVAMNAWKLRGSRYKDLFIKSGILWGVPPVLLSAICCRETGFKNIIGDNGHGIGLMQIDLRFHAWAKTCEAMDPPKNINFGAKLLAAYNRQMQFSKQDWNMAERLKGAVAAYNCGIDNVRTIEGMDIGTTSDDYSDDVWAMAKALESEFKCS
jgi:membrane-bound lytic murein transglycosylase MltF